MDTSSSELARRPRAYLSAVIIAAIPFGPAPEPPNVDPGASDERTFGAAAVIIELTEHALSLQVFVDGARWKRLRVYDAEERKLFDSSTRGKLARGHGLSETFWSSHPVGYADGQAELRGAVKQFLTRFPSGTYAFRGVTVDDDSLVGEATLTHVLPARPRIVTPVRAIAEPPVVDREHVVIAWEPVSTRFVGTGPVRIIEYQILLAPVSEPRATAWVDGYARRTRINLPSSATTLTIPPALLLPNARYTFTVLAIEASGNTSHSTGVFVTTD